MKGKVLASCIAVMFLALAGLAAFYPLFREGGGEVHVEYLIFGAIAAFMIFLFASIGIQIKCPDCKRHIPSDAILCPYCGRKLE